MSLNCCICDDIFPINVKLIPLICLQKNGTKAHKICEDCWWYPVSEFAREDSKHLCPGCMRGLKLLVSEKKENEILNLTND